MSRTENFNAALPDRPTERQCEKGQFATMEQTQTMTSETITSSAGKGPTPFIVSSGMTNATLAEVAHEARNMVAALGLYCELLEEPGVFTTQHQHYGSELKMVAAASRGLVDRLLTLSAVQAPDVPAKVDPSPIDSSSAWPPSSLKHSKAANYWEELPPAPINNLAWELQANRNLLAALAGPSVAFSIDTVGGEQPVSMSSEDLTRILVNLLKNSVEAMPSSGGRIQLILRECQAGPEEESRLLLNVEDNGLGFSTDVLEHVFEPGYTTRLQIGSANELPQAQHRGLGLSITRSIVEAAGGRICAANRDPVGACIQIDLPVRA